jgi:hypothetical protein
MPANVGVVVVEGMTDFIAAATNPGWSVFPVIGITSGSWNCEIAARIPNGAMVLVWTDADDVGDEYAERIDATLKRRCSVLRGRPDQIAEGANDLCDLVHLGKLPERPNTDVTQISKVEDWVSELVSSKVKHGPLLSIDHWSVLSGSDWLDTKPPPQRFLLCDENGHGVLARGKAGLLAGAGAVGKTTLLADLGLAAATGKNWLGELGYSVEEPGAVAMVLAEDDDKDVRRRIYNLSRRKELDAGQLDLVRKRLFIQAAAGKMVALTEAGPERGAEDVTTEYSKWLFNQLKTCAPSDGWALIVLDPLSRFAGPDVEADNSAATRLVQVIETFLTLPGNPTVLVSHHTTKESRQRGHGEAVGVRGSSALTDGFRWVGTMTYDGKPKDGEKERLIAFRIPKSNYAAWSAPKYLVRVADGGGMLRVASAEEIADHKKKQGDDNHDDGDATQGGWGQGG